MAASSISLERWLMRKYDLKYTQARSIADAARSNLGLNTSNSATTSVPMVAMLPELEQECVRLYDAQKGGTSGTLPSLLLGQQELSDHSTASCAASCAATVSKYAPHARGSGSVARLQRENMNYHPQRLDEEEDFSESSIHLDAIFTAAPILTKSTSLSSPTKADAESSRRTQLQRENFQKTLQTFQKSFSTSNGSADSNHASHRANSSVVHHFATNTSPRANTSPVRMARNPIASTKKQLYDSYHNTQDSYSSTQPCSDSESSIFASFSPPPLPAPSQQGVHGRRRPGGAVQATIDHLFNSSSHEKSKRLEAVGESQEEHVKEKSSDFSVGGSSAVRSRRQAIFVHGMSDFRTADSDDAGEMTTRNKTKTDEAVASTFNQRVESLVAAADMKIRRQSNEVNLFAIDPLSRRVGSRLLRQTEESKNKQRKSITVVADAAAAQAPSIATTVTSAVKQKQISKDSVACTNAAVSKVADTNGKAEAQQQTNEGVKNAKKLIEDDNDRPKKSSSNKKKDKKKKKAVKAKYVMEATNDAASSSEIEIVTSETDIALTDEQKGTLGKVRSAGQPHMPLTPDMIAFSPGNFNSKYKIGKQIGEGSYSVVREAINKKSKELYAVKIVEYDPESSVSCWSDNDSSGSILEEISLLMELHHPYILCLIDVFYDDRQKLYHLVSENMLGGELFDRIIQKTQYNELDARDASVCVLQAIQHCHERRIAHRDLKPENLLLRYKGNDSQVVLADFGLAKKVLIPNSLTTKCGTTGYAAPEIIDVSCITPSNAEEGAGYDVGVDIWAMGVILFILLGGYAPFEDSNPFELNRTIREADYEFDPEYWGHVSQEAKELVEALLTVDPKKRLTASQALQSKWIALNEVFLANQDLGESHNEFKVYHARRMSNKALPTDDI